MIKLLSLIAIGLTLISCRDTTHITGWDYNNPRNGGFQKVPFVDQETSPGMILIEGGDYTYFTGEREDGKRVMDTVKIKAYYISKYEETNGQYLAYLNYLRKYYSEATYTAALPDTNVWKKTTLKAGEVERYVKGYLRSPEFRDFPVVGVSARQVKRYARWKTDRMNEFILMREGILTWELPNDSTEVFSTEDYLGHDSEIREFISLDPDEQSKKPKEFRVKMEDGILMPSFRLVTRMERTWASGCFPGEEDKYLVTPKPDNVRRYKRKVDFSYLNDVRKNKPLANIPVEMHPFGLLQVYSVDMNKYLVYGLDCNVSEIVGDSLTLGVAGASYVADWITEGKRQGLNSSVESRSLYKEIENDETGIYGFRLAMDRVGSPVGFGRKAKRQSAYKRSRRKK